jgi:aldehyde dehydrogenase (NAD+)
MARLFIGGEFRAADKVEPVIEAATGDPLDDGSAATESEIDDAIAAAPTVPSRRCCCATTPTSSSTPKTKRSGLLGHTIVRREPVGVVAGTTPWNYPQALAAMNIAPGWPPAARWCSRLRRKPRWTQ